MMVENETIDMHKYYAFRTEIRKLYDHDVNQCGDLCCKILEIRDKHRCINSIDIDISGYSIKVTLADGTSENKVQEIMNKIATAIGYFIVLNRSNIDPAINDDPDFETFINAPNYIFCDIIRVGQIIQFSL